jgi:hypothetical protein
MGVRSEKCQFVTEKKKPARTPAFSPSVLYRDVT